MKTAALIISLLVSASIARADQNADIYNGILTEAQMPASNLTPGLQTQAQFFAAAMNGISKVGMLWQSQLNFTLTEDRSSAMTALLGKARIMYKIEGPYCVRVDVTVTGHMPTADTTYRNIYVESVGFQVSDPLICV